jgi:hypothetical protein
VFGIAIISDEDEVQYWTGDAEIWNADVEEAAIFSSEANAEAAIEVLKRAIPNLSITVCVVELEPEDEEE